MQRLLLLVTLFSSGFCYLDVTLFQIDRRLEDEHGNVNPYRLAKRLYHTVYENVSTNATNQEAWAALHTSLFSAYSTPSAQKIESMFAALAVITDQVFMVNQEIYVGNYIDSFNQLMTGRRDASSATQRGVKLMQSIAQTFQQGVLSPITTLFYNPLDTEMIASLNKTDVFTYRRSLFNLFDCPMYYMGYGNSGGAMELVGSNDFNRESGSDIGGVHYYSNGLP